MWDQPQGRVSVFDASGTFVRSAPMHVSPLVHGFVDAFGRSGDALLALTNNYPSIQPRPNESYSFLVPVDSAGNAGEPLLRMPAPGSVIERWGSASARIEAPFRRKPVVLFSPDGSVLVGNTGSRQFRRFAYGGRLTPTGDFSADLPSLAVTRAERRAWTDSIRNHLASERERAGLTGAAEREFARRHQRLLEAVQFPLNHAYYLTAAQDDLGRLWLQLPGRRGDRTVRWQVRDGRTGALRRIVEHPAGGRVVAAAVRGGVLFTIEIDGDGAGRLVSYAART